MNSLTISVTVKMQDPIEADATRHLSEEHSTAAAATAELIRLLNSQCVAASNAY